MIEQFCSSYGVREKIEHEKEIKLKRLAHRLEVKYEKSNSTFDFVQMSEDYEISLTKDDKGGPIAILNSRTRWAATDFLKGCRAAEEYIKFNTKTKE